jgi:hypothetical protein
MDDDCRNENLAFLGGVFGGATIIVPHDRLIQIYTSRHVSAMPARHCQIMLPYFSYFSCFCFFKMANHHRHFDWYDRR